MSGKDVAGRLRASNCRSSQGSFANNRLTAIPARVGTAAVLLNVILILQSLGVSIPGLAAARKVVIAPPLTSIKGLIADL
ncbi:MAG TPA: hypothetical protein VF913_00145, partial [Xanthobacteraceae bacterium]